MQSLPVTFPDGRRAEATPEDVTDAVQALLMDGPRHIPIEDYRAEVSKAAASADFYRAIIVAIVERAKARGVVP